VNPLGYKVATVARRWKRNKVAAVARRWKRAESLLHGEVTPSLRVHALASVATSLR
jgi:hypothetical protein